MRAITLLGSLLAALVLTGCSENGSCEDNVLEVDVGSGTYALVDAAGTRRFPHDGRDVSVQVDRDAGVVRASWTDDQNRQVVETWRIVR